MILTKKKIQIHEMVLSHEYNNRCQCKSASFLFCLLLISYCHLSRWKETMFSMAPNHLGHFLIQKRIWESGEDDWRVKGCQLFWNWTHWKSKKLQFHGRARLTPTNGKFTKWRLRSTDGIQCWNEMDWQTRQRHQSRAIGFPLTTGFTVG